MAAPGPEAGDCADMQGGLGGGGWLLEGLSHVRGVRGDSGGVERAKGLACGAWAVIWALVGDDLGQAGRRQEEILAATSVW